VKKLEDWIKQLVTKLTEIATQLKAKLLYHRRHDHLCDHQLRPIRLMPQAFEQVAGAESWLAFSMRTAGKD
jgi:hypothetical protein